VKIISLHTNEDLKTMQSWSLQRKLQVTETRIIEWHQQYNGQVYVSFSGGKDSTVLLDIVRRIYPDVVAAYIDTGLEYPEIKEFVKSINNVEWLKPKMRFDKVISTYGYPIVSKEQSAFIQEYRSTKSDKLKDIRWNGNKYGRGKISEKWKFLIDADFEISDKCCDIMKKKPAYQFEKETGLHPIIGTMADESAQRKSNWLMYGCNAFDKKRPTSQPMSFWTEQDVLVYIKEKRIPYASVYGDIIETDCDKLTTTGADRTGCIFCGYGCHMEQEPNRFQKLKQTHPNQYEYCINKTKVFDLRLEDNDNEIYFKSNNEAKTFVELEKERLGDDFNNTYRVFNGLGMGEVLDCIGVNYK
jgi:3'-phosphoadenosine 5'-phosphosulfate sulfotransferase (PAPS reductase)/FAD synthetase